MTDSRPVADKRRRTPRAVALPIRHRRSAWTWVGVAAIAGSLAVGLTTWRSQPQAIEAPPPNQFLPTVENKRPAPGPAPDGMVWIPGGEFSMGAQDPPDMHDAVGMQATTDSRPVHRVYVDGFWMDATEVTNAQFARFVKATGYVTVAERTPRAEDFPGAPPRPGAGFSDLFTPGPRRAARRSLSVVVGRQRRELASSARTGELDRGDRSNFPSCTSRTRTRSPTRSGPASVCRPRRNGSLPRAAA